MSGTLAWEFLSPLHVNRAMNATDVAAVKKIFVQADEESQSNYFSMCDSSESKEILLDLFYHLFRFGKLQNMTGEKISTLLSLVFHTHRDSMESKATMGQAYKTFEHFIISHSVHRPPYSAAIFAVDDVKAINDYVLQSYFRHYKMYYMVFTTRSEAIVRAHTLGDRNEVPPLLPPLAGAVPLAQWEQQQAEQQQQENERAQKAAEEAAAAEAAAKRSRDDSNYPAMGEGLKKQLDGIKDTVMGLNNEKLTELEAKLAALEGKVAEANKPPSAAAKAPPKRK